MTKAQTMRSIKERANVFKESLEGAARVLVETKNALGAYDVQTFRPNEVVALLAAERDTAWNDAIEAACEKLADNWTWDDADFLADAQDDLRRILKKGDTP